MKNRMQAFLFHCDVEKRRLCDIMGVICTGRLSRGLPCRNTNREKVILNGQSL